MVGGFNKTHANIALASTFKTKLYEILKKQKHSSQTTCHGNRLDHSRPLLKEMKALNIYQINLIQTLKFMHQTKYGINRHIFLSKFDEVDYQYPTRFFKNSFYYKRSACKTKSFAMALLGPTVSNSFLSQHEKSIPHLLSFLKQIKFKLLNSNKETEFY